MKRKVVWWGLGVGVVVIAVVLALLAGGGGDDDNRAVPQPTASASQPVATPSPTTSSPAPDSPTAPTAAPKPVDLDETASIDNGATAEIVQIKSVTSEAKGPGEISAPAIQVRMRIVAGKEDVDLKDIVVNGYFGSDLTPAVSVAKPGGKAFAGVLSGSEEATGVYVFNVPAGERDDISIELYFSADRPPAVFAGSAI